MLLDCETVVTEFTNRLVAEYGFKTTDRDLNNVLVGMMAASIAHLRSELKQARARASQLETLIEKTVQHA